ncbi:MAG: hypothetical protein ABI402_03850 [Ferruginibacter sp.]
MEKELKLVKIEFDNKTNMFIIDSDFYSKNNIFAAIKDFNVELVEIYNVSNPTDLVMEIKIIKNNISTIKKIEFYKYRTEFILQKEIFIWKPLNVNELQIDLSGIDFLDESFSVKIDGLPNFSVVLFVTI